jgi:cytochrome c oxidase assembly protein subunit 11
VANSQVDTTRTITVEFDANARGPWDFKPAQRSLQVHPGELTTVMYEFRNVQNRTMAAQAIPSYAPHAGQSRTSTSSSASASTNTRWLRASKQWPVVFVIDPKLPRT